MRLSSSAALLAGLPLIYAQTFTSCDPRFQTCDPNTALSGTSSIDLTSGKSDQYGESGQSVSYTSDGAQLSVAASGNNPTLTSNWYIMYGHVDFVFKAAPGIGMVSTGILLSDDLDEIDVVELLGAHPTSAQSNYFSKGVAGSYNRGGTYTIADATAEYHKYSADWTPERIIWSIDGDEVRTVTAADAGSEFPQTPMQVKIGAWAAGDSTNSPGTIEWGGGPIDYSQGPFVMQVQSITAIDYSTGREYRYTDNTGSAQSIEAVDGEIMGNADGSEQTSPTSTASPQVSTAIAQSSVWPWVPPTGTVASGPPASTYLSSLGYELNKAPTTRKIRFLPLYTICEDAR